MSKIDLSKAKIGDKFRARDCQILEYVGKDLEHRDDKYKLIDKQGLIKHFYQYGEYLYDEEYDLDLIEQVFDEPLSAMKRTERDERTNRDMQKIAEIADEEKQELQRRQEVVELADRIFFSERGSAYSFKECIEVAEHSVNMIKQYLKEGKLC